jgi:hypothetical protein
MALENKLYLVHVIELNGILVQALPGPMHLGVKTGPLSRMFYTKLKEPCSSGKFSNGSYT